LLHTVLSQSGALGKPVVLTGAMRPASSLSPDGPQNLVDAMAVAATSGLQGVLVSFAGRLHHALHVQKAHPYRLDAFTSGETGVLGQIEEGVVRMEHAVPTGSVTPSLTGLRLPSLADRSVAWRRILGRAAVWPRVEIVTSHGQADGFIVDALLSHGKASADAVRGMVVAATGNGSVHRELEAALIRAQALGVVVIKASRCGSGRVVGNVPGSIPDAAGLSPVKARIALALELMLAAEAASGGDD
jgi:L-asparaginase